MAYNIIAVSTPLSMFPAPSCHIWCWKHRPWKLKPGRILLKDSLELHVIQNLQAWVLNRPCLHVLTMLRAMSSAFICNLASRAHHHLQ